LTHIKGRQTRCKSTGKAALFFSQVSKSGLYNRNQLLGK